jgi:hypothetical protein
MICPSAVRGPGDTLRATLLALPLSEFVVPNKAPARSAQIDSGSRISEIGEFPGKAGRTLV